MSAAVTIDRVVWTDLRFHVLAKLLGTSRHDAIGRMAELWSQATEQGRPDLSRLVIAEIADPEKLIEADLAEPVGGNRLRLKGSNRLDWLERRREAGRKAAHARWHPEENQEVKGSDPPNATPMRTHINRTNRVDASESGSESGSDISSNPARVAKASDTGVDLAVCLANAIRSHKPNFSPTGNWKNNWGKDLDRAISVDGRTADQLKSVIEWVHKLDKTGFWRPNILSGKKLRAQFDQIEMRMKKSKPSGFKPNPFGRTER